MHFHTIAPLPKPLLILAALLTFIGTAGAGITHVSTNAELRAAINAAEDGDTIIFANDISLSNHLPMVAASITIDGGGHKLDGAGKYRGFFIVSGTVRIEKIDIVNVRATGGAGGMGAAASNGTPRSGGGGGGLGAGAAVFVNAGAIVALSHAGVGDASAVGGAGGAGGGKVIGSFASAGGGGGGGIGGAGGHGGSDGGGGGGGYSGAGGDGLRGAGGGGGEFGNGGFGSEEGGGGGGGGSTGNGTNAAGSSGGAGGEQGGGAGGTFLGGNGTGGSFAAGGGGAAPRNADPGATGGTGGIGGGGGGAGDGDSGAGGDFGGGGGAGGAGRDVTAYHAGAGGFGAGGGGHVTYGGASGAAGGFGAGGGGAQTGGPGGQFGGTGGSATNPLTSGGGGGAALGGAIFVRAGGQLSVVNSDFTGIYSVVGGQGGAGDSRGANGDAVAALAYSQGDLVFDTSVDHATHLAYGMYVGGAIAKHGAGELAILSGVDTTNTAVTEGTLRVEGQLRATGTNSIAGSATLAGNGSLMGTTLLDGTLIGERITLNELVWSGGGDIERVLGSDTTSAPAIQGALIKGGAGSHRINLTDAGAAPGTTFTILAFGSNAGFTKDDFIITGMDGTLTLEANALKFTTTPHPPVYGVSVTAAKGRDRATFTIKNTGTTTTSFRIVQSHRVTSDHTGPKPPKSQQPSKPAFQIVTRLNGTNVSNSIATGTTATIAAESSARVVVKIKTRRKISFRREIRILLRATGQADVSKSASSTATIRLESSK